MLARKERLAGLCLLTWYLLPTGEAEQAGFPEPVPLWCLLCFCEAEGARVPQHRLDCGVHRPAPPGKDRQLHPHLLNPSLLPGQVHRFLASLPPSFRPGCSFLRDHREEPLWSCWAMGGPASFLINVSLYVLCVDQTRSFSITRSLLSSTGGILGVSEGQQERCALMQHFGRPAQCHASSEEMCLCCVDCEHLLVFAQLEASLYCILQPTLLSWLFSLKVLGSPALQRAQGWGSPWSSAIAAALHRKPQPLSGFKACLWNFRFRDSPLDLAQPPSLWCWLWSILPTY